MQPSEKLRPIEIEVQIDEPFIGYVKADLVLRSAGATLTYEGVSGPAELTVVVTGDGSVRRLNRTYRGVDTPTDVLAFSGANPQSFVSPAEISRYLGDVIISYQRAEEQAQNAGHSADAELQLLTVHGVLHLLGHDHAQPDQKAVMWNAQAEILRQLGVPVADPTPEPAE